MDANPIGVDAETCDLESNMEVHPDGIAHLTTTVRCILEVVIRITRQFSWILPRSFHHLRISKLSHPINYVWLRIGSDIPQSHETWANNQFPGSRCCSVRTILSRSTFVTLANILQRARKSTSTCRLRSFCETSRESALSYGPSVRLNVYQTLTDLGTQ